MLFVAISSVHEFAPLAPAPVRVETASAPRHDAAADAAAWLKDAAMNRTGALGARLLAAEAALDCLHPAVFVLGADATVQYCNLSAQRLLASGDGLARSGERLTACINGDAARLREMIRATVSVRSAGRREGDVRTMPIRRGPGRPPLIATAVLLAGAPTFVSDRLLLFVADPAASCVASADVLRDGLGLTEQEIRVALCTLRLGSLPEAAATLGIALTTARSHLQHVFDKTGTRSQVALSQMLAALGALPVMKTRCGEGSAK